MTAAMTPRFAILLVCFFLSGATGLVYEVVWLRMLGLIFGHTVYAITTVLAAFMAGLALGSFLFAQRAARTGNLVRAYGILELAIGAYAALIPGLLWLSSSLYLGLHHVLSFSYDAFSFVQFLVVFAILLVPTTLMGGTLPILTQALAEREGEVGRTVGMLYGVNTFGAVVGVVMAGYVLLPALGNQATIAVAAIGNVLVGAVALLYGPRLWRVEPAPAGLPVAVATTGDASSKRPALGEWLTIGALGLSGAVSMIYEVAWTRALTLVIGSSTYAFTSMLVAFLVGIAGGSAGYAWLWGTRRHQQAAFAAIQAGIGLAAALTLLVFERMPALYVGALRWSDSPSFIALVQFAVSAAALLPFTVLIGATFPCAVAVVAPAMARVGRDVGQVYAVNTFGAIGGAIVAGFVLIPAIGVHASIRAAVVINLLTAGVLLVRSPSPGSAWRWGAAAAALVGAVSVPFISPWDHRVMASGGAIYAKEYLQAADDAGGLAQALRVKDIVFYRDGPSATVSVTKRGDTLSLRINGKVDASATSRGSGDMPTQIMNGHLPLLVHADPRVVLVIGLGSGITAAAVARHPIERLDIVEIEPAVVEANRFFADATGNVLRDPRVRMVVADARNFLGTTPNRYDVIISEPSNPWIGGVASLFTVEFFRLLAQRLRPGGVMLQWIHTYGLLPGDVRLVVSTFRAAFPATTIWRSTIGDYLLMGRTDPAPIDLNLVRVRYEAGPAIRRDLDEIGARGWAGWLGYFMLGEADAARYSEGGGLNTDDRLQLEFSAPRALYLDTMLANYRMMRGFKTAEFPEVTVESRAALERADVRYWIGAAYLRRGALVDARSHFLQALRHDARHVPSLLMAGRISLDLGRPVEALEFGRRSLSVEPRSWEALYLAGLASEKLSARAEALAFLRRAVALRPDNAQMKQVLARVEGQIKADGVAR
jgi:spermidine synthase